MVLEVQADRVPNQNFHFDRTLRSGRHPGTLPPPTTGIYSGLRTYEKRPVGRRVKARHSLRAVSEPDCAVRNRTALAPASGVLYTPSLGIDRATRIGQGGP